MDGEKIREVRFKDGGGIIANSGSVTYGQRVAELTQEACAREAFTDYRQIAESAERSVKQVNTLMLEPFGATKLSSEEIVRHREQNNYSILVANYFDRGAGAEPFLFTIESVQGVANRQKNYVAIGCGAGVAEFLISWFDFSKMNSQEAALTAAFIIGEVKKADCYCGGPTQIQILYSSMPQAVMQFPDEAIGLVEAEVEKGSRQYKAQWAASIAEIVGEISKKL
jgi:20S proteasome alpha/beta subunit